MSSTFTCRSPIDGGIVCERPHAVDADIAGALADAAAAARSWRATPLKDRTQAVLGAVKHVVGRKAELALDITRQMGRPIRYTPGEIGGFEERARHMAGIAEAALADIQAPAKDGFTRFIRRAPIGPVFVIAPWNYPWLTSVNAIVPALLAGNPVILKHSAQTPLVAEAYGAAFAAAGLPKGVFQFLHLTHDQTSRIIAAPEIKFTAFTGSVEGGAAIERAAAGRFIGLGLELGGKDPGYVREDADLDAAVAGLIDGAFFNSGQSCCGIERIYVHRKLFDGFVEKAAALTKDYVLGDPTDEATTLGPMVKTSAADFVRKQVA
ncbi:MAG: aldehyde dehydrogenase family protein, partial [Proteobacteria bacterium]|nr:aldehyde dehydrogenase family protein [Pseudomonadota bacterium]